MCVEDDESGGRRRELGEMLCCVFVVDARNVSTLSF